MHLQPLQDPLEGCVLSSPTEWPGRLKLEYCPSEQQFEYLKRIPGVYPYSDKRHPELVGWYVPRVLVDMGRLPAAIGDYPPEPNATAPSGLKLYEYQARTVTYFRQVSRDRQGALLVAEAGLGKTLPTLHALYVDGLLNERGIIVAPKLTSPVWCDSDSDITVHYGMHVVGCQGIKNLSREFFDAIQCNVLFCHFEILHAWEPWIFEYWKPRWLIADEMHMLANHKSGRTKAVHNMSLGATIERRYGLTGTAFPNELLDLWAQLAVVQPHQWGANKLQFGFCYCDGQRLPLEQGGGLDFSGKSNELMLRACLAGTYLCYTDAEVSATLPPAKRHVIEAESLPEDVMAEYDHARRDLVGYLRDKGSIPQAGTKITFGATQITLSANDVKPEGLQLLVLTTLITILSRAKQEAALKAIAQIMADHNRLVVFTWRRSTAVWISERLKAWADAGVKIAGKTPKILGPVYGDPMKMSKRKKLARELAATECGIYVCTIKSVGMSINHLSCASAGLFVDLHWSFSVLRQGERRIQRTGCTASRIDFYFLLARGTVDDLYLEKLEKKASWPVTVAPHDTAGVNMVTDLMPARSRDALDVDLFCSRLMDLD